MLQIVGRSRLARVSAGRLGLFKVSRWIVAHGLPPGGIKEQGWTGKSALRLFSNSHYGLWKHRQG